MTDSAQNLYLVFSSTPYRMGRWIRYVTGEPYNHISIATDGNFDTLYSFARRYYHTPFYGGFVSEESCRFHHKGISAQVQIYKLPLNREQWKMLHRILEEMQENPEHYLYNHLSAMTAPLHQKIHVKDAYTCAEFAVHILSVLGFSFDPDRFYSIGDISQPLERYLVYDGSFPNPGLESKAFYSRENVSHPLLLSSRDFGRLCWRVVAHTIPSMYALGRKTIR